MSVRVLYLDDEIELCEIFADEFANENIQISTFTDPQKAIDFAVKNPPDVIFLDYRLVATSGEIVAKEMANSIPKYLITGEISVNADYPFVEILAKPYDIKYIKKILDSMLQDQCELD